jgi:hypothetical protein
MAKNRRQPPSIRGPREAGSGRAQARLAQLHRSLRCGWDRLAKQPVLIGLCRKCKPCRRSGQEPSPTQRSMAAIDERQNASRAEIGAAGTRDRPDQYGQSRYRLRPGEPVTSTGKRVATLNRPSEGFRQVGKTKDVRAAVERELGFDPTIESAHHRQQHRRHVDGEPVIEAAARGRGRDDAVACAGRPVPA